MPTRRVAASLLAASVLVFAPSAFAVRSVFLVWDSSTQTNIAGYQVYCGTRSHHYTSVQSTSTESALIPDLVEGKTYYFAVTASNTFGLESDLSEELVFTVPLVPTGKYAGLFYETQGIQQESSGAFTLSVTRNCTYSGRLRLATGDYSFAGKLTQRYRGTNVIVRPGATPLVVHLNLAPADATDAVSGQVSDGTWTADFFGDRAVFDGVRRRAPWKGRWTIVIPSAKKSLDTPAGDGYGRITVDAKGNIEIAGGLGDGTKFTQSAVLSRFGQWPLYLPLYTGRGLGIGWVGFKQKIGSDMVGTVYWARPRDESATFYPDGFVQQSEVVGSIYRANKGPTKRLLDFSEGMLSFSGGNLGTGFTNHVSIRAKDIVTTSNSSSLSLDVAVTKGTFRGRATDPATGSSWPFVGVLMQGQGMGRGYLVGSNATSRVLLVPFSGDPPPLK